VCNKAFSSSGERKRHVDLAQCDENDVKSWALIKETSVACPKCGTSIQKVSGCNQMWCTVQNCNTAFDWATGKVINGPIHNPHYHDFLRTGAVQFHDNMNLACIEPNNQNIAQMLYEIYDMYDVLFRKANAPIGSISSSGPNGASGSTDVLVGATTDGSLVSIRGASPEEAQLYDTLCTQYLRVLVEIIDARERRPDVYGPESYESLRLDYLQQKITKTEWASKLSYKETVRQKMFKLGTLLSMFKTASWDILLKFYTESRANADLGTLVFRRRNVDRYGHNGYVTTGQTHRTVKAVQKEFGLEAIQAFSTSFETLRVYYATQLYKILSDYTCGTAKYPEWINETGTRVLRYYNFPMSKLKTDYAL
jgi:hypothetical protein